MRLCLQACFVYDRNMAAELETGPERALAGLAAAIGEPARAGMLCALLDRRARTGTELAMLAGIAPSTASVHLKRLAQARLVTVRAQGRHRYYALGGARVARALETLGVLAGAGISSCVPTSTRARLRLARSCYDHIAGALGVAVLDRLLALGWLGGAAGAYEVRAAGRTGLAALGIDAQAARTTRRRFAYGCLDWSERRPHLAGALGAAFFEHALRARWLRRALDGRELTVTAQGRRTLGSVLGLELEALEHRAFESIS